MLQYPMRLPQAGLPTSWAYRLIDLDRTLQARMIDLKFHHCIIRINEALRRSTTGDGKTGVVREACWLTANTATRVESHASQTRRNHRRCCFNCGVFTCGRMRL